MNTIGMKKFCYTPIATQTASSRKARFNKNFFTGMALINGGWSAWSPWTACRCNGRATGGKRRTRTCTEPYPLNGGAHCQGPAVARSSDCVPCQSALPGRWGSWSEWSVCEADCRQSRRRSCTGDTPCSGQHIQYADCVGDYCGVHGVAAHSDVPLYIGIAVAVVVFLAGAAVVYKLLQRKTRDHSLYTMTRTDFQPEMYPTVEKQSLSLAPDLMQHRPPRYEHPPPETRAEHHYDVPHLTNSYASPVDHQVTPCASSKGQSDDYDSKPYSESEHSASSCFTSSGSMYDAANESVTLQTGRVGIKLTNFTILVCVKFWSQASPASRWRGFVCTRGSFPQEAGGSKCTSLLSRMTDIRPRLGKGITQLSPVVKCGPPTLYAIDHNNAKSDNTQPQWKKVVSLGQETINTPVFTQLDNDKIYLVTDMLSTFVLVGESFNGKAVKALQLAIYAPSSLNETCSEYNIRLYVFEDTPCAPYYCQEQEKKLGGGFARSPENLAISRWRIQFVFEFRTRQSRMERLSPASVIRRYRSITSGARITMRSTAVSSLRGHMTATILTSAFPRVKGPIRRTSKHFVYPSRTYVVGRRGGRSPRAESQRSFNITENLLETRMCRSEDGSDGEKKCHTVCYTGSSERSRERLARAGVEAGGGPVHDVVRDEELADGGDPGAVGSAASAGPGATAALAAALRQVDRHDAADLLHARPAWL
ncbi:hypothetical protein ACJJTC_018060 [Scirpophaga incertulas]